MLSAIEREQFIKLYKFGEFKIQLSQIIDGYQSVNGVPKLYEDELEKVLPNFEQDHEILIIDISKARFATSGIISNDLTIRISDIQKIYPLTEEASRYLVGRFNQLIKVEPPVFAPIIEKIKENRDWQGREKAAQSLLQIFNISHEQNDNIETEINKGIKDRIQGISSNLDESILAQIVRFDRNPIYPEGPKEHLLKLGSIYVESKGGNESNFEKGPLFNFLVNDFNYRGNDIVDCLNRFQKAKESRDIIDVFQERYPSIDLLVVGVWYLFLKDSLLKSKYNLFSVKEDIQKLVKHNPTEAGIVLYMIGMIFSFDNLYESIYLMSNIPLFSHKDKISIIDKARILSEKLAEQKSENMELNDKLKIATEELQSHKDKNEKLSILLRDVDEDLFDLVDKNKDGILESGEVFEFIELVKEAKEKSLQEEKKSDDLKKSSMEIISHAEVGKDQPKDSDSTKISIVKEVKETYSKKDDTQKTTEKSSAYIDSKEGSLKNPPKSSGGPKIKLQTKSPDALTLFDESSGKKDDAQKRSSKKTVIENISFIADGIVPSNIFSSGLVANEISNEIKGEKTYKKADEKIKKVLDKYKNQILKDEIIRLNKFVKQVKKR